MDNTNHIDDTPADDFEEELIRYEAMVKPKSNHFRDFRTPAAILKGALIRLVESKEADTYSMMRRLFNRMRARLDDHYSEYTINMLAASSSDTRGKKYIMAILSVAREVLEGGRPDLHEQWLSFIDNNYAIFNALSNYSQSDQSDREIGYGGEPLSGPRPYVRTETDEAEYTHKVGCANYAIRLTAREPQVISLALDEDSDVLGKADPARPNTIVTDIILSPNIKKVVLDKSLSFYDDAVAQIAALKCSETGVISGADTIINLPDVFYSVSLNAISSDAGKTWRITEVNILPPSIPLFTDS